MLVSTLNNCIEPGGNLTATSASHASWRFLLPRLDLGRVVCLGEPDAATLDVLASCAESVTVVGSMDERAATYANVHAVCHGQFDFENTGPIDLLYSCGSRQLRAMTKSELDAFCNALGVQGAIYVETSSPLADRIGRKLTRFLRGRARATRLHVAPPFGRMQMAFNAADLDIAGYMFRTVLYGNRRLKRWLSALVRTAATLPVTREVVPRSGLLVRKSTSEVPAYLLRMAAEAGLNLDGYRVGLSARGQYETNKNVLYLFSPGSHLPQIVVKASRTPKCNPRVLREHESLSRLHGASLVPVGTYPVPLFSGEHAGLQFAAQTAAHGTPFRRAVLGGADSAGVASVLSWVTTLGRNSRRPVPAAKIADALRRALGMFDELFPGVGAEMNFLSRQIDEIASSSSPIPLVFEHGDLGTWNLLLSGNELRVLDWENADHDGMPLWDLNYFLLTAINWQARQSGVTDRIQGITTQLIGNGPWAQLFRDASAKYCFETGLDPRLVMPMFYTSLMSLAIRESFFTPEYAWHEAEYLRVLRFAVGRSTDLSSVLRIEAAQSARCA